MTPESTALTVQQRASVALGAAEHEKKLIALAKQSTEIVAITNPAGYQQLHVARMVLKNERVALEKIGKAARDDATKFSNAIIAEQKRLIGIIEPEEERLLAIQEEHDTRVEREKAAKIEAERLRVERIQAAIAEIKAIDNGLTLMSGSALIEATLVSLKAEAIDERFAEFRPEAEQAKVLAVIRLNQLRAGALEYEAEQKRVVAEREELARLKAAEDRRQREAAEKEAAEIRRRGAEQAAAQAKIDQAERESRLRIDTEERKAREAREEQDRLAKLARAAEERKAAETRAAEEARLKKERDRLDAEVRALAEKQRQERETEEIKQREIQRKADELLDAQAMLTTFKDRYGRLPQFAGVTRAIIEYFKAQSKQKQAA